MADTKISDLTALTTAATGDLLVIVDISDTTMAASGTDKQITAGELLISGLPGEFSTLEASGVSTLADVNATDVNASGVYKVAAVRPTRSQQRIDRVASFRIDNCPTSGIGDYALLRS